MGTIIDLKPHQPLDPPLAVQVEVAVDIHTDPAVDPNSKRFLLYCNFIVLASSSTLKKVVGLHCPPSNSPPLRTHELWKTTCFEFFLKPLNTSHYWEFNIHPSGAWNFYELSNYRQGLRESHGIHSAPRIFCHSYPSYIKYDVTANLTPLLNANPEFNLGFALGLASVIQWEHGAVEYFALHQPSPQPDFHHPNNFCLLYKGKKFEKMET